MLKAAVFGGTRLALIGTSSVILLDMEFAEAASDQDAEDDYQEMDFFEAAPIPEPLDREEFDQCMDARVQAVVNSRENLWALENRSYRSSDSGASWKRKYAGRRAPKQWARHIETQRRNKLRPHPDELVLQSHFN